MAELETGFFGKLPSNGDFVRRRVATSFGDAWDNWLQSCVHHSRQMLGEAWLDTYLTSPVWRYWLGRGVIDDSAYAGILLPSVDSVGRYFPFSAFVKVPEPALMTGFMSVQFEWFEQMENLLLNALEADDLSIDALDNEVCAVLSSLPITHAAEFDARQRVDVVSFEQSLSMEQALQVYCLSDEHKSLWWSEGSESVFPCALNVDKLPNAALFTCMLDGQFKARGFQQCWLNGANKPTETPLAPVASAMPTSDSDSTNLQLRFNSYAVTDAGSTRDYNEDNFLDEASRGLWVVADGMGGHSKGDVASQWTVESLKTTALSSDWVTSRDLITKSLDVTNRRLRDLGGEDIVGSTIVLLYCNRGRALCMWAGDSRIYRLTNQGLLEQLTADHSLVASGNQHAPSNVITRAVGVEDDLTLDTVLVEIRKGERFLLCSDGLYSALREDELVHILRTELSANNAADKLIEQSLNNGADDNVTALVVDVL